MRRACRTGGNKPAYGISDPPQCDPLQLELANGRNDSTTADKQGLAALLVKPADGLVEELQSLYGSQPIDAIEDNLRLVLCCITCFRRTRSLVALRSILRPRLRQILAEDSEVSDTAVDRVLRLLEKRQYVLAAEGGYYWMPRQIRDRIYEANSKYTSRSDPESPITEDKARRPDSALQILASSGTRSDQERDENAAKVQLALGQAMILALHHGRIARYYYSENYVQSHDAFAFLEYIYHRVSCIRYLTQLLDLVDTCEALSERFAVYLSGVFHLLVPPAGTDKRPEYLSLDQKTKDNLSSSKSVLEELCAMRSRELHSFLLTWLRSRTRLQSTVPAEQLISWCDFLKNHDLEWGFPLSRTPEGAKEKVIEKLREEFISTISRCGYERTDFLTTITIRAKNLLGEVIPKTEAKIVSELLGKVSDPALFQDSKRRQAWLYIGACLIETERSTNPAFVPDRTRAIDFLKMGEADFADRTAALSQQNTTSEKKDSHHAITPLRYFLVQARAAHAALPFWRYDQGADTDRQTKGEPPPDYIKEAKMAADSGLGWVRWLQTAEAAVGNHRLYFLFRSLYLIERGRVACRLREFESAYRDFDLARSGLDSDERIHAAEVELAAAECALMHAHDRLRPDHSVNSQQWEDLLAKAGAKHSSVISSLRRALDHLLHSRRNVLWWLDFNRLAAFYHADRNLWRLSRLCCSLSNRLRLPSQEQFGHDGREPSQERLRHDDREIVSFVRALRLGLLAINFAAEIQPTEPDQWPVWLRQALTELVLGATVFGALTTGLVRLQRAGNGGVSPPVFVWYSQERDWKDIHAYLEHLLKQIDLPREVWDPLDCRRDEDSFLGRVRKKSQELLDMMPRRDKPDWPGRESPSWLRNSILEYARGVAVSPAGGNAMR